VALLLIECPLYLSQDRIGDVYQSLHHYTETAMTATYEGKPAVRLRVQGTISNADGRFRSSAERFVNPTTFLPIARLTKTWGVQNGVLLQTTLATFALTAMSRPTLPHDFFDPASLGYRGADAVMRADLARMPSGFPAYWLGMHWKGTAILGPLAVSYAEFDLPGQLNVSYGPEGRDRFGTGVIHLWEVRGGNGWPTPLPSGPCFSGRQVALPGGYGILVTPLSRSGCARRSGLMAFAAIGGPAHMTGNILGKMSSGLLDRSVFATVLVSPRA
jgi:hypothetical protein